MQMELQLFKSPQFGNIRIIQDAQGEPWFCGKDIMTALDYNPESRVSTIFKHVPSEWKGGNPIVTLGGTQQMLCLSEQGLYFFLGRSDKPKALPFQKWISGEVLPSIRRTGGYLATNPNDNPEAILARAVLVANDAIKRMEAKTAELEAQITINQPKVLFADSVSASNDTILVRDMAKILRQNGVLIGEKRLFHWLRANHYLIKQSGSSYNRPTQLSMERGLFRYKETCYLNPTGARRLAITPKITGKGQQHILSQFLQ